MDKDKETIHLGAFKAKKIIGVLSAFQISCPQFEKLQGVQLRAIARSKASLANNSPSDVCL